MESKDLEHPGTLTFGEFALDPQRRGCFRGADRVHLTPKAFDTLLFLASNPGRAVSKKELLKEVWGGARDESTVEHVVRQIRLALDEDKDHPRFLKTIPWQGYLFLSEVASPILLPGGAAGDGGATHQSLSTVEAAASSSAVPVSEASPTAPDRRVDWEQSDTPKGSLSRRTLLGGIAATLAASAIGASWFRSRSRRAESAVLNGNLLTALDGMGAPLWTHRFPGTLQPQKGEDRPEWRVQVLDLEGTGDPGVLAVCSRLPEPSASRLMSDELFYFGPEGQIRWTYSLSPDLLDFNGQPIEPVWRFSHVIPVPHGKQQTLWAGVQHGWRWPGCVMRFDGTGTPSIQFANSGFVERLCRIRRPDGEFIAVSGENNAFDRACAAVLGINDQASCSPGGGARRCTFANAPAGQPRDYILFPTTEMLTALESPYGHALQVYPNNDGGFVVEVHSADSTAALFLYEFSAGMEPRSVMPSGSCPLIHHRLQLEGKLNHSCSACPELANPLTIRHWRPNTGWCDERVPWRAVTDQA